MFQSLILANLICLGGLVPVCSGNVCWCQRPETILIARSERTIIQHYIEE
jgi:hypothetical protein